MDSLSVWVFVWCWAARLAAAESSRSLGRVSESDTCPSPPLSVTGMFVWLVPAGGRHGLLEFLSLAVNALYRRSHGIQILTF